MSQSGKAALVQSELFRDQMDALTQEQRALIWRSLNRARERKFTPGVENPWGGDYLLWPCGPNREYQVLLRPLNATEVLELAGHDGDGFYLYRIEPSPI
jgi:hypothetical protein